MRTIPTDDGTWHGEDLPNNIPGDVLDPNWLNSVAAELEAVIVDAGEALDPANNAQVLAAINKKLTGLSQTLTKLVNDRDQALTKSYIAADEKVLHALLAQAGAVIPFALAVPPSGWLECNGQAISRVEYATLYAAIGTTYGAGDGTTFNVPDFRGEFIRGWDHGRGVDAGRELGSAQGESIQSHAHDIYGGYTGVTFSNNEARMLSNEDGHNATFTSASVGGSETRPRNVALMYCIKY